MKVIEQGKYQNLEVSDSLSTLLIAQEDSCGCYVEIDLDKTGAKELIKVLQEFVDENTMDN